MYHEHAAKAIRSLPLTDSGEEEVCEWDVKYEHVADTSGCGFKGVYTRRFKFCPYCGKPIKLTGIAP